MDMLTFLEFCLTQPVFWVGVAVGLTVVIAVKLFLRTRDRDIPFYNPRLVEDLIERMHRGEDINIEVEFAPSAHEKKPMPPRFQAWRCFAYWIADQCTSYEYSHRKATDILLLGKLCFGEKSIGYTKLVALEEILNRSTKYYLDKKRNTFRRKEDADFSKLLQMVDLIIESTYPDLY